MFARFLLVVTLIVISPCFASAQGKSDEEIAIKRIEALGGTVRRDVKMPDSRVISIVFNDFERASIIGIRGLLTTQTMRHNSKITDEDLKKLTGLKSLSDVSFLSLGYCPQITDAGVSETAKFKNLTYLGLAGCTQITDSGIAKLAELRDLERLDLTHTQITGNGLKKLKELENLTSLYLQQCQQITDADMKELGELTNLKRLRLTGTSITDVGMLEVAKLTKLRFIDLSSNNKITDVGLMELRELKELVEIHLMGCTQITNIGCKEFKKALPNLLIERR